LSIKRYNTFSSHQFYKNKKERKAKKVKKEVFISKKRLWYFAGVILLLAGIKLFYNLPALPLSSEEKSEEMNRQAIGYNSSNVPAQFLIEHTETLSQDRLDLERLNLSYQRVNEELKIEQVSGTLNEGETLYQHLVKVGISPAEILRLAEKVQSVVDISRLNAGTKFTVHYNREGKVVQFDYQPNQLDAYYIKIPDNELANIEVTKEEIFREIVCLEGVIESSLYQAMVDYGSSSQLAVQLAEIFAWDIDFLTECQPGDTFKILVERLYRGDFYRWGDILAAVYEGEQLSTHTAILFQDPAGNVDYYDKDGRCLRKAFLRAPLNYKYISSYYTESRLHPILRIWRPHLAIDYAAPAGTPVVAIGAGTVISRYYDQGGYGNYVQIRHPNGYITGYGHLSKFAQGLQVGKRVEQGEIIGYVGATGLATGPHLDFSISKDGKRINFLELKLPPASSVSAECREDFELVKKNYLSILKEEL
jgi:murein DD-endopeptidase MepM/ murein hydrolase activator NlpD